MKNILTVIAIILTLPLAGQNVISTTRQLIEGPQYICGNNTIETTYYLMETIITENVTGGQDTATSKRLLSVDGRCPADSAQLAEAWYTQVQNINLQLSGYIGNSFSKYEVVRQERGIDSLFLALTGKNLVVEKRARQFQEYDGLYRVFTSTGNFFANIAVLPNGTWRLRQLTSQTGDWDGVNQWVLIPGTRNSFQVNGLNLGFGAQNYTFYRDLSRQNAVMFFPEQRLSNATGTARIVKVN